MACERLAQGQLRLQHVGMVFVIYTGDGPTDAEEVQHMQAGLSIIVAALQHAPVTHVRLTGWSCTPAVASAAVAVLAPALAAGHRATMDGLTGPLAEELVSMVRGCAPMRFSLHLYGGLIDEQLSTILQLGEQVSSLSVGSIHLQSNQHANTPWPWEKLTIEWFDIADLCKLPDPRGTCKPRVIEVKTLVSGTGSETEVSSTWLLKADDNVSTKCQHHMVSIMISMMILPPGDVILPCYDVCRIVIMHTGGTPMREGAAPVSDLAQATTKCHHSITRHQAKPRGPFEPSPYHPYPVKLHPSSRRGPAHRVHHCLSHDMRRHGGAAGAAVVGPQAVVTKPRVARAPV